MTKRKAKKIEVRTETACCTGSGNHGEDSGRSGDEIRARVSRDYAEALRRARTAEGGGCCSPAARVEPAGSAAKLAGYGEELAAHPEAGASSFGCGNPLAFADVRSGEWVLDLGSGAGLDILIAAEKVGPAGRVIGVDMTAAMVEAARANARRAGLSQVEVRQGVIEDLPVADSSVDWVISNCVVNLSPEKERVFAEIHRVLKPGGRFSISDLVVEDLPASLREQAIVHSACIGGAISAAEYVAGLESAGLADVRVSERIEYDIAAIRGLVESDLVGSPADARALEAGLAAFRGSVASVRLSGRRPGGP
ncbi:MAG: arsenite methyltransferase [Planctomycetota bacterium]